MPALRCHRLVPAALAASALAFAAPGARSAGDVRIDGQDVYPESIGSSKDGALYIGSIRGTVYRALPGSARAEPWIVRDATNGLASIFGVLADDRSHTLFVCSSPVALPGGIASGSAAVMRFDLASGAKRGEAPLPSPRAVCDDVAIARDGPAYVADIANGEILTLAAGASELRAFARDAALEGKDGIAFGADGRLYIDNVRSNQLLRVERTDAGGYAGLTVLTASRPLAGPDGFRHVRANRFVLAEAQGGRIDEVTISGDRAEVRVLASGLTSPSAATAVGDTVYALEGKIGYLIDPKLRGQRPGEFVVRAISLTGHAPPP